MAKTPFKNSIENVSVINIFNTIFNIQYNNIR